MKNLLLLCFTFLCGNAMLLGQQAQRFPEFIYPDMQAKSEHFDKQEVLRQNYLLGTGNELRLKESSTDKLGMTHDKYEQFYKGFKVDGATVTLHSKNEQVTLLSGNYQNIIDLDVVPAISPSEALQAAMQQVKAKTYMWEEPLSEHNDYQKPTGELVVILDFFTKNPPKLAYKFDIYAKEPLYRGHVYIDAKTGEYLEDRLILIHANVPATGESLYDGTVSFTAENVGPYRLRQTSSGGGVQTFNLNNGTNYGAATDFNNATTHFTADDTGVEAHWASEQTYDYFLSEHGRNSYNNAGAVLKSYVHYSVNYVNAFWDGSRMTYGDGNGGSITPLVTLDICGHEITHAVTQFTAGLIYQNESGALNESFSDIFGEMVEAHGKGGNDWDLGDEIGVLIRDMANPNATGCPDTYHGDYWYYGAGDNGGVHFNSGVQNKWFYLISVGENGTNDNGDIYCVEGLGIDAAADIAYRNLSVYLSGGSNYAAARTGAIQAARDIFGIGSKEEIAVTNAWYAVGVGNPYPVGISCPGSVTVNTNLNVCQATYNYTTPVGVGNCPTTVRTTGLASGSNFPVGNTVNTFRVTDADGLTSTCSFTVTVVDAQNPSITCPANINQNALANQCYAPVSYTTPTASDNCGIQTLGLLSGLSSGSNFPVGTTTNTWRAQDVNGRTSTCAFTVTVTDATNPTINCPANISVNTATNQCGANVTYSTPTGSDNCGLASIILQSGLASGSFFPVGITNNVWRATDLGGRTSTCAFSVTVNDGTPPVITCPANVVGVNDPKECGAFKNYNTPTATDNCSNPTVTLVSGLQSGSYFQVGSTPIVWRATDASGNSATCSFTVTIVDTEAPTIICPADRNLLTDPGECSSAYVPLGGVQVEDNCSLSSLSNNAPSPLPVGENQVIYTAVDASGNASTCVQLIKVRDLEPPAISCPANLVTLTDEGSCEAVVDYQGIASDNCAVLQTSWNIDPQSSFPIGYTDVYFTVEDIHGNTNSCHFQVRVNTRKEICNGEDDDCDGLTDEADEWKKVLKQLETGGNSQDRYGYSVDILGDWAIVGTDKHTAHILSRNQNGTDQWGEVAELAPANSNNGDQYGARVAIGNGIAAVSAPGDDSQGAAAGAVYVYYQNGQQWNLHTTLHAQDADAGDRFGSGLALNGDVLLVGAMNDDEMGTDAGAAYVFARNQGGADAWGQVKKLLANNGSAQDNLGISVSLDGDYAIAGAPGADALFQNTGAAYIFGKNEGGAYNWGQVTRIRAAQSGQDDQFGASVGISGSWAVVGAANNDSKGQDAGAAYIFTKNHLGIQNLWGLSQTLYNYNGKAGDRFGHSVAIDQDYLVVGTPGDDPFGQNSGGGFVYLLEATQWIEAGYLTDGSGQAGDQLGQSVAISGRRIMMGAPEDEQAQGSVQIFEGLCVEDNNAIDPNADRDQAGMARMGQQVSCYPVPFSSQLNIALSGINSPDAQVLVTNMLGQEIATIYRGAMEGDMTLQWYPNDTKAGWYFIRVVAGDTVVTQPVVLVK
ncbi:MAG: HYR domain-containing protein [Saprospiraceae bacterium]|nr:HYR domain-containing protein [Saprospiraceae bacterium]